MESQCSRRSDSPGVRGVVWKVLNQDKNPFHSVKKTYFGRAFLVVLVMNSAILLYSEKGPQCQEGRSHTIA